MAITKDYSMPRIPQISTQKESHISGFQLATSSPQNIGVPKASPTRMVAQPVISKTDILIPALKDLANVFAQKAEITRTAESQSIQMKMNESFRELWKGATQLKGGQTVGMLEHFQEQEGDLREEAIPTGLDAKTTQELTQHFNQQFTGYAGRIVQHVIAESARAEETARQLSLQDAHENINSIPIGGTRQVDQEIENVITLELARHPNLTPNQQELNRRAVSKSLVTSALIKWSVDSPVTTLAFWKGNQTWLKRALGDTYSTMAKKMEVVGEDAAFDTAFLTAQSLSKGDNALAAELLFNDDEGTFGLNTKQRLTLANTFRAKHKYKVWENETQRLKEQEDFLVKSHKEYYDTKTLTTNTPGAIAGTEQAYRQGIIDTATYETRMHKLAKGQPLTAEAIQNLRENINNREITTVGEILEELQGTHTPPEPFISLMNKRTKEYNKGYTDNYFKIAEERFRNLARIKKMKDLPEEDAKIKEKGLLVDIQRLGDFKRDLDAYARQAGYSAGDPRILELVDKMLSAAWYSEPGLFIPSRFEGLHYGKAPWRIIGEEVGRAWEFPEFNPFSETATGGSPVQQDAAFNKLVTTPEGQEAYARLIEEKITPTVEMLQFAIENIAKETIE